MAARQGRSAPRVPGPAGSAADRGGPELRHDDRGLAAGVQSAVPLTEGRDRDARAARHVPPLAAQSGIVYVGGPERAPHAPRSFRAPRRSRGALLSYVWLGAATLRTHFVASRLTIERIRSAGVGVVSDAWAMVRSRRPPLRARRLVDGSRVHASAPALERRSSRGASRALDAAHAGAACASSAPRTIKLPDGGDALLVEGQPPYPVPFLDLRAGRTNETWQPFGVTVDDTAGVGPPEQRLREQDMDGLLAEVLFPNMQVGPRLWRSMRRRRRLSRRGARVQRLARRGVLPRVARSTDRARRHSVDELSTMPSPSSSTARGSASRASTSACSRTASRIRSRRTTRSGRRRST